jgi:hypothetical protein
MVSDREGQIRIGAHLSLITEQNSAGPGAYIRGVEFDGVTGMARDTDRDWRALDPAFSLAKRLGCDGIWFRHSAGIEFLKESPDAEQRCRELASCPPRSVAETARPLPSCLRHGNDDPDGWPTDNQRLVSRLLKEPGPRGVPVLPPVTAVPPLTAVPSLTVMSPAAGTGAVPHRPAARRRPIRTARRQPIGASAAASSTGGGRQPRWQAGR